MLAYSLVFDVGRRPVMRRLGADVVLGQLGVPVRATYRLEEVPQAIADFAAGTLVKLVVSLD